MSDTVVDSSVMAKWVLAEADSPQADRVVTDVGAKGGRLIALDLAFVEVVNAAWKRLHRGMATLDETRQALDDLLKMPVQVQRADRLLRPALEIAAKYDHAIYDALFVALCQDLSLSGVTADELLHKVIHTDFPQVVLLRDW